MTKLEQAARQALGALEVATTPLAKDRQEVLRAITTLREALSGVQALSAAPEAIAKLRHLYQNMVNGAVRDTASAKRIAEGLLAPAIEALERATPPAEQQAAPKAAPGEREQAAQRLRELAGVSENDVTDPLHQRYIEGYEAGHAAGRKRAAPQQEAQPNYVVSLVVVKEIPTGVNTQNKLYTVNAASADEAVGKAVLQMPSDFPEHRLHTACFVAAPAQPAPAPLSEMPYEKRKAIQEGKQISASDAWFKARHEMLDTVDRRNVFRAGFDRGWNAALAAQGVKV